MKEFQTNRSFYGQDAHASMLPSTIPLTEADLPVGSAQRLRGGGNHVSVPVRTSIGGHKTARKKDIKLAEKYKEVREKRAAMGHYWDGDVA